MISAGEDDASIAAHLRWMVEELAKNVPNMAGVDDRMSRTLLVRRADVLKLPLSDILVKYPAFKYDGK